jgi:DNA invertase Pin-like site-specific DNA recombinase
MDAPTRSGKALLYARVSTQVQVTDGVSLDVQERQLLSAAEFHGFETWDVIREEGKSGKNVKGRPVLQKALKDLELKVADALIVTRIDRLARSTSDFLQIVDQANKQGWRLIMLDLNLDTSTYQGRFVVTVMSALAEMERGIIAARQKDVHKDRRERGIVWGKDMGPMNKTPQDIKDRIMTERAAGRPLKKIADALNADGILTDRGNVWYASSVKNIVDAPTNSKGGILDDEKEKE